MPHMDSEQSGFHVHIEFSTMYIIIITNLGDFKRRKACRSIPFAYSHSLLHFIYSNNTVK